MTLADDTAADAPKIHSLGLLQPLAGRYLDIITDRVKARHGRRGQGRAEEPAASRRGDRRVERRGRAGPQRQGTVPDKLPEGLGAILNPGNVKAVVEADAIDPLALAAAHARRARRCC